ncbi:MAG: alpha-glucan family phosphorylase [Limnochordia bacterium]|jgi:starch phosphorylase
MDKQTALPRVAYFCMEFGLHEELVIYAGGLGILAGDILKAAHDLQIPMVGVGILWHHGYTAQHVDREGKPYDTYPPLKMEHMRDTGVVVHVQVGRDNIPCRVWRLDAYGNVPLYLLDTNIPGSPHGWITRSLYGGGDVDRVAQEIVLGIGGVRALRKLGIPVDIYHFNEGHAVLAGIELLRERMAQGESFETALRAVRSHVVFTTHTPVLAGNEFHEHAFLNDMGAYNGLNYDQMCSLGGDPFGMTVAGLRLAQLANGVSKMHGVTAREMWADVDRAAPVMAVTNGVHRPTWQDPRIATAFENKQDLWPVHSVLRNELLVEVAARTGRCLNPDSLLIGFARRAATYKRSDLILQRRDVIEPLLASGQISLIFSGKAHPNDENGKKIVSNMYAAAQRYPNSVVYLENYDMYVAKRLVRGCDVWLNNPRRPLEASGTSGMKAAMNGVLNLSILDGWWPEGCQDGVTGWQFGDGYQGPDQNERDLVALYETLLDEVLPTFRNRRDWEKMMRASIDMAQSRFCAERMVTEYVSLMYLPVFSIQEAEERLAQSAVSCQTTC